MGSHADLRRPRGSGLQRCARRCVRKGRSPGRALRRPRHPGRDRPRDRRCGCCGAGSSVGSDERVAIGAASGCDVPLRARSVPTAATTSPRPATSNCRRGPHRSRRSASDSVRGSRRSTWMRSSSAVRPRPQHEFALRKAADGAELQMSEEEESLAGELAPSGSLAWQRLHGEVSSQLTVELRIDGASERVPMAFARGLATHPDAARRRAAYDGELEAWATVAVPLAAALNGAKGELGVLNRRRGFVDDLEPALRANNVDRATLDAMTSRGRRVVARVPSLSAREIAVARALGRPAVVGPLRAGRARRHDSVDGRDRSRPRRVRRLLARSRRPGEPRVRRDIGSTPRRATESRVVRTARALPGTSAAS